MPELDPKKKDLAQQIDPKKPLPTDKKPAPKTGGLKGMTLEEQMSALSVQKKGTAQDPNAAKAPPPPEETPYAKVVALLQSHRLPAVVAPKNIASFDLKGEKLTLNLANGFTKEIVDDKGGKNQVKFDAKLTMKIGNGKISGIEGITVPSSHGARVTDIQSLGNGFLRLTGKVGIFSKSLDIKEADFPPLP